MGLGSNFIIVFLALVFLSILLPVNAFAYLDMGSQSYFFQFLIAGLLAFLFYIKIFWRKFFDFFKRIFGRK